MFRKGKRRLDIWLPADHPIFKVPAGERTMVIQHFGDFDVAMSYVENMKDEILIAVAKLDMAVARIEKMLKSGAMQIKEAVPGESIGQMESETFSIDDIYREFGGLATTGDEGNND